MLVAHTTGDGTFHDGPQAGCALCKKKRTIKQEAQKRGSAGGRKSKANVAPARTCTCGKKIARSNKTGLCVVCLRAQVQKLEKVPEQRYCTCCKKKITKHSKTGFCAVCVRSLPGVQRAKQEIQDYITSGSFNRSVHDST